MALWKALCGLVCLMVAYVFSDADSDIKRGLNVEYNFGCGMAIMMEGIYGGRKLPCEG